MAARIIDKDQVTGFDRWSSPSIDESAAESLKSAPTGGAHLLTARQLESLQQQAHQEGYDRGFQQGLADGRAEAAARAKRLDALIAALSRPFDDLDAAVEHELAALAVTLAAHLLRRELQTDAGALAAAVKECIGALPVAARHVVVRLNPEDARLAAEHIGADAGGAYRIEADETLARGDVVATAQSSNVDGRLEARVQAVLDAALTDVS